MDGLSFTNIDGRDVFIPLHAIDRLTVEPHEKWKMIPQPWWSISTKSGWMETGKWSMKIETAGRNTSFVVFDTREEADAQIARIKEALVVSLSIGKVTIRDESAPQGQGEKP